MIIIITNDFDHTSYEVSKWLHYRNVRFIRISNLNDFYDQEIEINIDKKISKFSFKRNAINLSQLKSIWYRRTPNYRYIDLNLEKKLSNSINATMQQELLSFYNLLKYKVNKKHWINHPDYGDISKIHQLYEAKKCGLNIPGTIVTTEKENVELFIKKYKKIIVKPSKNALHHVINEKKFLPFTSLLTVELLNTLPLKFFPTLFQENIEKEFEIRSFYLNGHFYSMAIFSQNDKQTSVDFRNYNYQRPNRNVPFLLPSVVENKLIQLMKKLKLNSGSFDLIYTPKGDYYFLEVNPVGQFGMVSQPCNYYLEKILSQTLIGYDN